MKKECKNGADSSYSSVMIGIRDIYEGAGTIAWRHWYERCAVGLCDEEERDGIRSMVIACVRNALRKESYKDVDIRLSDLSEDFLVQEFDKFMEAGGNISRPKAYKQYLKARFDIRDDSRLKELICGAIFSREKGWVREIARKAIENHYGWTPHTVTKIVEGKKRKVLVWEKPPKPLTNEEGEERDWPMPVVEPNIVEDWDMHVRGVLFAIGGKTANEAALLAYAICEEISPSNKNLQKHLGVAQVMTYRKVNSATQSILKYMKRNGLTSSDVGLITSLRGECAKMLGSKITKELE